MLKIIIMALLIFAGMVGYDTMVDKPVPTAPDQKQEEKINRHEKSAVMAIFTSLLPPRETWPSPVQKFYLAFNMETVIDPIRQNPQWTPLKSMSQDIPRALIAIEDHDFYNHGAIAVDGVLRALLVNLSAGEVVQGGSTITQQFIKNVFLTHEQSMERKIEEAVLSLMLEDNYTKDEILELYLNTTYFGAGANGINQAAKIYFGKAPSALTLAEAAVIASLPYAPSALNPLENPKDCKQRQLLVLNAMHKYGMINQSQLAEAKAERIRLANGTRI
ncbi:transglycosylase domain-containing protein [uncultured Phascolarctobacterium sp.]|uniref:transglycosylase domain-containing protein n=1 Tax=uncultured Phascolarctobacterium sp. TaxID=512296 RepID=UPI0026056086|nr:biosynthetic peptidoglycan transglycosylase [uncultured Phascolarctobacterium sp.]